MSVSGVNSPSQSDPSYSIRGMDSGDDKSGRKAKDSVPVTTYSIGYDRVSKQVYDRYDSNGDGRINNKEIETYQADKSGAGKKADDSSETSGQSAASPANMNAASASAYANSQLGNNIDLLA